MKNLIAAFFISVVLSCTVFAQYGSEGASDARSMGMGKTSINDAIGVYSIGVNPANLLNSDDKYDISTVLPLPHLSASAGTNFISINNINYYFGTVNGSARELSDADKQNLNSLFNNGGRIAANASVTLFAACIRLSPSLGAIGFSLNDYIEGNITLPEALPGLLLNGNIQNSTYNFNDAKFNSWWLRSYSFTYAREIPQLTNWFVKKASLGFTIKRYQGFAYVQSTQASNNSIQTGTNNQITLSSNYVIQSAFSSNFNVRYSFDSTGSGDKAKASPFPSPAGSGTGFDIGITADFVKDWSVSLSLTDLGSITWNSGTAITTSKGTYTITQVNDKTIGDSLKDIFKGNSVKASSFKTDLPTTLRLGTSHKYILAEGKFPGTLLVVMDLNQGFNDEPGNSTKTRISIGGEWKMADWVPYLRTGFSFGGLYGFHWGLGLGIDAGLLEFNFATYDFQSVIVPNSAKYLSVALDTRWKF